MVSATLKTGLNSFMIKNNIDFFKHFKKIKEKELNKIGSELTI